MAGKIYVCGGTCPYGKEMPGMGFLYFCGQKLTNKPAGTLL